MAFAAGAQGGGGNAGEVGQLGDLDLLDGAAGLGVDEGEDGVVNAVAGGLVEGGDEGFDEVLDDGEVLPVDGQVLAKEVVGVAGAVLGFGGDGEDGDIDLDAMLAEDGGGADRGLGAGFVGIVGEMDDGVAAGDHGGLGGGEPGAAGGDGGVAGLDSGDDFELAFEDVDFAGAWRLVEAEQEFALEEELGVGGVEVLGAGLDLGGRSLRPAKATTWPAGARMGMMTRPASGS